MKKNNLIILAAVTVIITIIAVVANNMKDSAVSNKAAGMPVFAGLSNKVNDVVEVEITKGKNIINVQKKDNLWQVLQKDGYPANLSKVKETILKMAGFKTLEAKTKKPENFGKLNVEDPKEDNTKSILVTLKDQAGQSMASLVIGRQLSGSVTAVASEKTYVRKMDDNQVWLVSGGLLVDDLAIDWLDEQIMDIPSSRISKIIITPANGKTVVISKNKPEDSDFILQDMPKNKELKSPSELTQTARLLQSLRMKDVSAVGKVDMSTNPNIKTDIYTFDGLVVSAVSMQKDKDHYITLDARYDAASRYTPPAPSNPTDGDQSGNAEKSPAPGPSALKSETEVQEEAKTLSEKMKPWVYTLSNSKGVSFIKTMNDLLKDKEK